MMFVILTYHFHKTATVAGDWVPVFYAVFSMLTQPASVPLLFLVGRKPGPA